MFGLKRRELTEDAEYWERQQRFADGTFTKDDVEFEAFELLGREGAPAVFDDAEIAIRKRASEIVREVLNFRASAPQEP